MATTTEPAEYLTDAELAKRLRVATRTTMRWRRDGGGPPFVRCGARRVLYSRSAVDAWLAGRSFAHHAAEATKLNVAPAPQIVG